MPKDEFDPDDPMELQVVSIEGDFDEMAGSIVDEFILMNYDAEAIWQLFQDPFYRSTNAILQKKGEAYVRELIEKRMEAWAERAEQEAP